LPFLIAHLSLFSEDGLTSLDMGSCIGRGQSRSPPILYGNLVSVVEQLEDLQGNMGLFFLFPDVSIRWRGRYQLGVTLSRISKYVLFFHISIDWLTRLMFSADPSGLANGATRLTQAQPFINTEQLVCFFFFFSSYYYKMLKCSSLKAQTRLTQSFVRQSARMWDNVQPEVGEGG
jgi:hypothetical protein